MKPGRQQEGKSVSEWVVYVGTEDGIRVVRLDAGLHASITDQGIKGHAVRGIAIHPQQPEEALIGCGLRGWGLHRTRDAGRSFELVGFSDQWVWDVAYQPGQPETIWVGTEPPMVHRSVDGGESFQPMQAVAGLPSKARWMFFHPPFYAGHVHGFAISAAQAQRLFAGVEQGALISSSDGGQTWQEALVGCDLHRIAMDPENPEHVLAGAGEGLFASTDGGLHWSAVTALQGKYIHAVVFDPHVPGRIFLYADVAGAPLYRSDDNGVTWRPIGQGLPAAQPADTLCLHPGRPDVLLYAGDTARRESRLFLSTDGGEQWTMLDPVLPKVWRMRGAVR
jgi:photosystem II stability/assembly factor-like uncharacterized protein